MTERALGIPSGCIYLKDYERLYLPEPPFLDADQQGKLQRLFEGGGGDNYLSKIISCPYVREDPKSLKWNFREGCREGIIKALAVSVSARKMGRRRDAIEDLIVLQHIPEAREITESIAKSYPIPAIMEMAARIMAHPEFVDGWHCIQLP